MNHEEYLNSKTWTVIDDNCYNEPIDVEVVSLSTAKEACQLAMLDQAAIDALKEEEDMDYHYKIGWNMALEKLLDEFRNADDWILDRIKELKK